MGAAVRLVARSVLRRRVGSLVGVALLTALVGAAVLVTATGARRTDSSFDRMVASTAAADARVQIDDPDLAARVYPEVMRLPDVVAAGELVMMPVLPETGDEAVDMAIVADPGGAHLRDVERALVLNGRLPDPGRSGEVLIDELASDQLGVTVGDTFSVVTFSHEDVAILVGGEGAGFPGFNGPTLELVVVGVGRWPVDLESNAIDAGATAVATPAFLDANPDVGSFTTVLDVRLATGTDGVEGFQRAVRELAGADATDVFVMNAAEGYRDGIGRAVRTLAATLAIIGLVAVTVGLFVVTQAVRRHLIAHRVDDQTLVSLGMGSRSRRVAAAIPVLVATSLGAGTAVVLAVMASPWSVVGVARRAEVDPGVEVDFPALLAGSALMVVVPSVWAVVSAGSSASTSMRPSRSSALAAFAARLGVSPPAVIGIRAGTESPSGAGPVARSAIVGVLLGIGGLVGAGAVASSVHGLANDPARFGWPWSTVPDVLTDERPVFAAMAGDDRLAAVAMLRLRTIEIGGREMPGVAVADRRGDIDITIRAGRAPARLGEVAIGSAALDQMGASVGDEVVGVGLDGRSDVPLTVVGEAVMPGIDNSNPGIGAVVWVDDYERLRASEGWTAIALRYPPGTDAPALEAALVEDYEMEFSIYSRPRIPPTVANYRSAASLVEALAAFFAVLGLAALVHALTVSSRYRRVELGTLRALGLRPSQVRQIWRWQGMTIVGLGGLFGAPLGLALGRVVWTSMVGDLGVVSNPNLPGTLIAFALPAALMLAVLAAWWPGQRAATLRPAVALRVE